MAANGVEVRWMGTVSREHKKQHRMVLLLLGFWDIFLLILILEHVWISIIELLIILFLLIMLLASTIFLSLRYFFNKFAEYQLTSESLIHKDWNFLGRLQIRTLPLSDLQQFYFETGIIYFFIKKFDDWGSDYSKQLEQSVFYFWGVDSLEKLIEILLSIIPFKKHPTLENTYQRIE